MFERGNVHRDFIRQIARQTFHSRVREALLKQTAKIFHSIGDTHRLQRNICLDYFVHRNGMKIDVQNRRRPRANAELPGSAPCGSPFHR